MKKFFIKLIALILISTTLYGSPYQEAKNRLYASAIYLTSAGFNLKGANGEYLSENGYRTYSVYLYSGNEYAIIGAGSDNVRDLDVQVYDLNWNLIASDNDRANVSVVKFYPPRTGSYYIRTKMYSGSGYFFQMVGWR